ncbi:hypothetical protein PAAG_02273 [Paracoccidioides lutzii Pb01]|uniref:Uncharacterized protein n=1 Tax=Paracoccidioides lutzii (strain ATCC MYA-826 / Pb01) TaxID=502779 RepID=C1GVJ6_PARBA|nr:hypothetical protein PAAG_02273 [Paracoccidioides lutzii Pb01]EEH40218.2 hypothetical protein PAAG_02273 [Paracoccidioides lutzii Pb01]
MIAGASELVKLRGAQPQEINDHARAANVLRTKFQSTTAWPLKGQDRMYFSIKARSAHEMRAGVFFHGISFHSSSISWPQQLKTHSFKTYIAVHPKSTKPTSPCPQILLILHQRNQAMRLNQLLALSSFLIPALAIGRECCCDRYSQFALENEAKIVAQCKTTWSAVKNGASGEDYCNSVFCIQQQSWIKPWLAGKCTLAGYQCGDCANGNVGCLG